MITSRCQMCGQPKDADQIMREFREGAEGLCPSCVARRSELQEYVVRQNAAIAEENAKREAMGEKLLPTLDASSVIREGMKSRVMPTMGHIDPRTGFNPGFVDPRYTGLGMGAKLPPNAIPLPPALAPEVPPGAAQ